MANYPDFVLKYKEKGVYVNKVGDNYYLYKAHCERINGKNVRISDGYIGKVTEKDGLIPSKGLISSNIMVYEYGFYYFIYLLTINIYKGQKKLNKKYADSIMLFAFTEYFNIPFVNLENISLSLFYSKYSFDHLNVEIVKNEIQRVIKMIDSTINNIDHNYETLRNVLSTLYLIKINKRFYLSNYNEQVNEIFNKYNYEVKIYVKD